LIPDNRKSLELFTYGKNCRIHTMLTGNISVNIVQDITKQPQLVMNIVLF